MRGLVIEDDPMIGRAVVAGLQDAGYTVDWVRDGAEAELALGHHLYDLALLDLGRRTGVIGACEKKLAEQRMELPDRFRVHGHDRDEKLAAREVFEDAPGFLVHAESFSHRFRDLRQMARRRRDSRTVGECCLKISSAR